MDDSDDETIAIINEKVSHYADLGFDIKHIRRINREGFKAGALQYGMSLCKGEFIAIFDADFLPSRSFLIQTIHHFKEKHIGILRATYGNPKGI